MGRRRFPDFLRTDERPEGARLEGPPRTVVFHHQPKTAGSTFRGILESLFDRGEVCPGEIDDEVRELTPEQQAKYRLYAGHFTYDTVMERGADAIRLIILRNPIERVISNFYNLRDPNRYGAAWIRRADERPGVKSFLGKVHGMTLEEFVHSDLNRARDRVVNRQTRYLVPKSKVVKGFPKWDDAMLGEAKRNLEEQFAFAAVQEEFDDALALFLMTFGLPPIAKPERFNTNINVRERSSKGYDVPESVLKHLEEHNRMDLALWDHARALMHARLERFERAMVDEDRVLRGERDGGPPPIADATLEPRLSVVVRRAIKDRLPDSIRRLVRAAQSR